MWKESVCFKQIREKVKFPGLSHAIESMYHDLTESLSSRKHAFDMTMNEKDLESDVT